MSKQSTKGEEEVPIPTSFEVNGDEKWAANHTEFKAGFVPYATSDESDGAMLNRMYQERMFPGSISDEAGVVDDGLVLDRVPTADVDLGLPPNASADELDRLEPAAVDEVIGEQPFAFDEMIGEQPAVVDEMIGEQPVAAHGPTSVDDVVPVVTSSADTLERCSTSEEEEEERMEEVDIVSEDLVLGMAEDTLQKAGLRMIAATKSIAATIEGVNKDATDLIFPSPRDDKSKTLEKEDKPPSTQHPSGASVCHSVDTTDTNWSKRVMKKMKSRKKNEPYAKVEELPSVTETEDTREPEESRATYETKGDDGDDEDIVWKFMTMCQGLTECFENVNGGGSLKWGRTVQESVFREDVSDLTEDVNVQEVQQTKKKAAKSSPDVPAVTSKGKKKKSKMKNLFRRKRSAKQ